MTTEPPPFLPPPGEPTPHEARVTPPPQPTTAAGPGRAAPVGTSIQPRRPGLAIAALVLGILSVPLYLFLAPGALAVVFGLVSGRQIKNSNGRLTGIWMSRVGWILGAITTTAVVGLFVLIATGVVGGDDEVPQELEVGDCVLLDEDAGLVLTVPTVDCGERHNGEVVFVGQLNTFADRDYPGEAAVESESGELCIASWPDSIGVPFEESEFDVYFFLPRKSRWKRDRGEFVCMATSFERDLTSTILGSRR